MPKFLIRIVACLLLPCQFAGAAGFLDSSLRPSLGTTRQVPDAYIYQALAQSTWTSRPIIWIQTAAFLLRRQATERRMRIRLIRPVDGMPFAIPAVTWEEAIKPVQFMETQEQPSSHIPNPILVLCDAIVARPSYQADVHLSGIVEQIRRQAASLDLSEAEYVAHRGPITAGMFQRLRSLVETKAPTILLAMQAQTFLYSIQKSLEIFRANPVIPGTTIRVLGLTEDRGTSKAFSALQLAIGELRAASPSMYDVVTRYITTIEPAKLKPGSMASHSSTFPGVLKIHWPMRVPIEELPLAILEEAAHDRFHDLYPHEDELIADEWMFQPLARELHTYGTAETPYEYLVEVDCYVPPI